MARPLKLTAELQTRLCKLLAHGAYAQRAAAAVGIGETTFFKWMRAGAENATALDGVPLSPANRRRFRQFRQAVENAQAMAEQLLLQTVRQAAYEVRQNADGTPYVETKDWRAAAWILERKFPDRYGDWDRDQATAHGAGEGVKRPVVFGARYAPSGALVAPTLPALPAEVIDVGPNLAAHDGPDSADDRERRAADERRPKLPDV